MNLLFTTILLSSLFAGALAADRANILLIMAYYLRDYGGAFTQDVVKTPNLDQPPFPSPLALPMALTPKAIPWQSWFGLEVGDACCGLSVRGDRSPSAETSVVSILT